MGKELKSPQAKACGLFICAVGARVNAIGPGWRIAYAIVSKEIYTKISVSFEICAVPLKSMLRCQKFDER
ncbi:MAG: hypothetical protein ACN6O2_03305 [Stenotrophomonas sp.]